MVTTILTKILKPNTWTNAYLLFYHFKVLFYINIPPDSDAVILKQASIDSI
jgi:hypothetical protein